MNARKRVGVLLGGLSSEREVSLRSGDAVHSALLSRGHDAVKVFVDGDLDLQLRAERIEVAFLALHGRYGEDGCVQGLLELRGIPYTGSSLLGSAISLDKLKTKELLRHYNLPTAAYYVHHRDAGSAREQHGSFGYPAVVKPRSEGSSLGVRRVDDLEDLESALDEALRFDDDVIVERLIEGREVHVALAGGQILGAAEICPEGAIFDSSARTGNGNFSMFCPPRLSPERLRGVSLLAERAIRAFELDGLVEIDFMISELGNEHILEIDAGPAMGPHSPLQRIARSVGVEFADLIEASLRGARLHTRARREARRIDRRAALESFAGQERRAQSEPH